MKTHFTNDDNDPIEDRKAITIFYDDDGGALSRLVETKRFTRESAFMRADVLKDLLYVLDNLYQAALCDWNNEIEAIPIEAVDVAAKKGGQ